MAQQQMTISERRFREGKGVHYLKNGSIRCHAISKTKVRAWRLEHNDEETPTQELWPDCQCGRAALPGLFLCKYHGGLTRKAGNKNPKSILDVVPVDLRNKLKTLFDSPDYISRKQDILLLKARQWELLENLNSTLGGQDAWELVHDAIEQLRSGEVDVAETLLEQATDSIRQEKEIWDEVYRAETIIKDLTTAEVKNAKELRSMVTAEQVMALVSKIYDTIAESLEKYIEDPKDRREALYYIGSRFGQFTNLGYGNSFKELAEGSRPDKRDSE